MALTNRLYESARGKVLTTTILALSGLAALVTPSYCAEEPRQIKQNQTAQFGELPQYSIEKLRLPTLPKEMSEEERKNTQSYYQALKPVEKIEFKEIFSDPKTYIKEHFKTQEERRDFQDYFNIELMKIPQKERNYMEGILTNGLKRFPWKSSSKTVYNPKATDDYTLSRRLWQYYQDKKFEDIVIDNTTKRK